jgi:putative intracellular protease/amidase
MGSGGGDWKSLFEAAKRGDADDVRTWLSAGVDPNFQHVEFGSTALMVAAENGHMAVARMLVQGGADPLVTSDWDGRTARQRADEAGHSALARWLDELASPAPGRRALMVLPHTDFDPTETAIPWTLLVEAGFRVTFATPDGQPASADPRLLSGRGFGPWRFLRSDEGARDAYARMTNDSAYLAPQRYADVDPDAHDVLHLPGGHAPGMKSFLESEDIRRAIAAFFRDDKVVGAICHGVLAVARTRGADGRSVLYGRKTTALPARMELIAWRLTRLWLGSYYRTYPKTVQAEVTEALASAEDFATGPRSIRKDRLDALGRGFVVEDGNYVSGRWPGDARRYGTSLVAVAERAVRTS